MRQNSMLSATLLLLSAAFGVGLIVGIPRPVQAQQDVAVRITADNAYGFGYGKVGAMASYFGGIENGLARDIFSCNPDYGVEVYTVPAAAVDDFLYVVAWSDKAVTQGVIAEFKAAGRTVYSGIGDWQVYATGQDFRPPSAGPGPSLDEINRNIGLANAAAGAPDCLCEQVRKEAPAWLVDEAQAHPERFEGWRQRLDPGKPFGPLNPLRECLNLRNPNLAFHPLWNSVIWKVGCH